MGRPSVSVVMPFAGDQVAAGAALGALRALDTKPGDDLILVENSDVNPLTDFATLAALGADPVTGGATVAALGADPPGVAVRRVTVVRACAEHSPAHARNVGAEHAGNDWILFLDADCRARVGLLGAYFAAPMAPDLGALAGEVVPAPGARTLTERYGAARSFLSQEAHLAHPYLPRAAAANLLVRRAAFDQLGGFYEGVRAAEDTDFSWRLQQAGWRLELRREASVEHRYRASVHDLRRQWRGYAAGRAWLSRRYEGFTPEPGVRRAWRRAWRRCLGSTGGSGSDERGVGLGTVATSAGAGASVGGSAGASGAARTVTREPPGLRAGRLERCAYLALDVLLAAEELLGLALSNRPADRDPGLGARRAGARIRTEPAEVVLVADRFPARGDRLVELALALGSACVEAAARPQLVDLQAARRLAVVYREDEGAAARALALARLAARHPLRCALDVFSAPPGAPSLSALAPAALRLGLGSGARVQALGLGLPRLAAARLAALGGRSLEHPPCR